MQEIAKYFMLEGRVIKTTTVKDIYKTSETDIYTREIEFTRLTIKDFKGEFHELDLIGKYNNIGRKLFVKQFFEGGKLTQDIAEYDVKGQMSKTYTRIYDLIEASWIEKE